jgi:class 3 adenylate cyclase
LQCAHALQQKIGVLDKLWKGKKTWNNTLKMNMGLHCRYEWLGTIPSSLAFEFTVIGDTRMETVKLSDFAQGGAIWASKKVIEGLSPVHRQLLEFGIRHGPKQERFVSPGIYSQVKELLSPEALERSTFREIGNLAVAEIFQVHSPAEKDF